MFACPACSSELTRTTGPRGIYWVCPGCKGRAVNLSLLRRQINRVHFNRLWQTAWEGETRSDRKCPGCQKPMVEVPFNPPPDPLVLDACKPCQFVWFDASELEKIPEAPPDPIAEDPIRKLPLEQRQAIAEQKVREIAEQARRENHRESRHYGVWGDVVPFIFELFDGDGTPF